MTLAGRSTRWRRSRALAAATASAALVFACTGGAAPDSAEAPEDGTDLVIATSPAATRPPIELGDLDPGSVFVGDGLAFGLPDAETQVGVEGYIADPLVEQAVAREVFSAASGVRQATVVVLDLASDGFTSSTALDAYVRGFASGIVRTDQPASPLGLGGLEGFAASSDARSVVSFRIDNLVVLVEASSPATATTVATALAAATSARQAPDGVTATPLIETGAGSAFVVLDGFGFASFPTDEEKAETGFVGPEVPLVPDLIALPEGRLVVLGVEIRGTAWAMPVSVAAYGTAENLVEPMRALATERSGGEVVDETIAGRTVYSGDAVASVRVFRERNLVLVVDGFNAADADAITSEWIRRLAGS